MVATRKGKRIAVNTHFMPFDISVDNALYSYHAFIIAVLDNDISVTEASSKEKQLIIRGVFRLKHGF